MIFHDFFDWFWHQKLGQPYRLNYVQYGSGDEPLLLLHGLASTHKIWRPLIRLIWRDWNIIAPDLLGFGDSPSPDWNSYDVSQHALHVRALLRRFKVSGPVTIVAHSMGCLVAIRIAYEYPGAVKRLILYEPPLFADVPNYRAHMRAREWYFTVFRYIATHPHLVFSAKGEMRKRIQSITGVSLRPETWVPFSRSLNNTIMEQSTYDELHKITVPTDIIHGRMDFVVTRADVKKMLAVNPHISFHTINGAHNISRREAAHLAELLA